MTIAGGGVAGLALAILLGREGLEVTVIERAPLPRDKVCGEGIMPIGLEVLRQAGIDPEMLPGRDFSGLEFHTPRQAHAIDFRDGDKGRGIRRTALISALEAEVRRCPSVAIIQDTVREPIIQDGRAKGLRGRERDYRAAVVVAADGSPSKVFQAAGMTLRARGYRMGIRRHFLLPEPIGETRVRVGLFPPYDLYLTAVGERELLATTMTHREGYRTIHNRYEAFLGDTPFGPVFDGAMASSAQMAWYQPLFRPERFVACGILAVGDAGGGIDPCLGLGISMALASARRAAGCIPEMLAGPGRCWESEADFDRWRTIQFRHYDLFDRIFRWLVTHRPGAEALLWGMRHWPAVGEDTTSIVTGNRPWRTFRWRNLLLPVTLPNSGQRRRL